MKIIALFYINKTYRYLRTKADSFVSLNRLFINQELSELQIERGGFHTGKKPLPL
ncbi:MAG: hypothetical protein Q8L15_09455 [Methylobacter sp.]|nr:hypothetical protein [Methylobacter sp.]